MDDELEEDRYNWNVASAAYQVAYGGPTRRTNSAIEFLSSMINGNDFLPEIAGYLLDLLVETRGLANLSQAIILIDDDEVPDSPMTPMSNVLSAVNDYGAYIANGPVTRLRFPSLTAAASWAEEAGIAAEVTPMENRGSLGVTLTLAAPVEVLYQPKKK